MNNSSSDLMMRNFFRHLMRRKNGLNREDLEIVKPFFDANFYLSRYKEVVDSGRDPLEHYLDEGWCRGFDPCPWFSTRSYLENHPDVNQSGINPLFHYAKYGRAENRSIQRSNISSGDSARQRKTVRGDRPDSDRLLAYQEFDPGFYRQSYPQVKGSDRYLFDHFMTKGWKINYDPSPWFSTSYYLSHYADIRDGGMNPLLHYVKFGRAEGRLPNHYRNTKLTAGFSPRVSVIIPNYNHARFLEQRFNSIVDQDWKPAEIVILDDASTDDSPQIIKRIARRSPIPVIADINDENSANVFKQWERGINLASGDLIWICESDDFCNTDFLSTLVPHFADPSVMIAFGKIQFSDEDGTPRPGLDNYRESAAPGYWDYARVESAYQWFSGPFGIKNVIANVGGCVFRRQELERETWEEAQRYSVCGDWFLYIRCARGGRIAYDPDAVSYFRQHSANKSVSHFRDLDFYEEHFRVAMELRNTYGIDDAQICRFYRNVRQHYLMHFPGEHTSRLGSVFDIQRIIDTDRQRRHILIGILGFRTGGGEILPIHLANALVDRGYLVSILILDTRDENPEIRKLLSSKIAIYERGLIQEIGLSHFLKTYGIDLVHTHYLGVDLWVHETCRELGIPYMVTHHGSYEVGELRPELTKSLLSAVDHWVYLADKNLKPFGDLSLDRTMFTKLPNAVPPDDEAFTFTRDALGIERDAIVFGLASRAFKAKGWHIAAEALRAVRAESVRPIYVAFCGDGEDYDELIFRFGRQDGVKFLGYHEHIQGFYRMCDCCIFPTRFDGESYPLTLIEALQADRPIIATDIGEIKSIVAHEHQSAGILLPNIANDADFTDLVANAMRLMLDDNVRRKYTAAARRLKMHYSFDGLTTRYEELYQQVAPLHAAHHIPSRGS